MNSPGQRPALKLVPGTLDDAAPWVWFCGHCAAPAGDKPPPPSHRVCRSCNLGLLLETRGDVLPSREDAFLVVDGQLLIQGLSRRAERVLSIAEDMAVNRPLSELLVSADAEAGGRGALAAAIVQAVGGSDESARAFVRPWNTFGVRMRARVAPCGPPRAALIVLEDSPGPALRAVPGQ
jgi:hypothetical protein